MMSWLSNHALHLVLISAYLAVLIRHALVGHRNVKSLDDYLVAGRSMGGFVIAMSFYATFMSTNTFIGAAGKSWQYGLSWCVGGIVLTTMACLSWLVVAPRFVPLTREYSSLTVADFLGTHYQSPSVRRLAGAIVAFSSVLYLVAIYRGASLAIGAFLDLPYFWCVIIVFAVVTTYTLMGGFESVVLTDAFQGVLMLVGAVALFASLLVAGGGAIGITERLSEIQPKLVSLWNGEGLSAAFAYSLAVGVKYLVEPRQLSRFYGLKDAGSLRTATWIAPGVILVSYVCMLPIGAMARTVVAPESITESDQVVPFLLGSENVLGSTIGTLFLLVLVSAAMSSIDSVLLVVASTIDRDLIHLRETGAKTASSVGVRRTRIWIVAISLVAATSALLPFTQDIVKMTKFSGSLYGACFLPVLVFGLFVEQPRIRAAITTMLAGSICVIGTFILRSMKLTNIQEVYPGILVGMLVYFVLSATRKAR